MYTESHCARRWNALMAPGTGDVKAELAQEAAEYFGSTVDQILPRVATAGARFKNEWQDRRPDPLYDVMMPGSIGSRLAAAYRHLKPRRPAAERADVR